MIVFRNQCGDRLEDYRLSTLRPNPIGSRRASLGQKGFLPSNGLPWRHDRHCDAQLAKVALALEPAHEVNLGAHGRLREVGAARHGIAVDGCDKLDLRFRRGCETNLLAEQGRDRARCKLQHFNVAPDAAACGKDQLGKEFATGCIECLAPNFH